MINPDIVVVLIAIILIIGYLSEYIFLRTKVPDILPLFLIGLLIGPIGHAASPTFIYYLTTITPLLAEITLIMIIYNGGLTIDFEALRKTGYRALLLGVLDTLFPMIILMFVMNIFFQWPYIYGALLGAVLGETATVVILPMIEKFRLPNKVNSLITIATVFNSIPCIIATFSILDLITIQNINFATSIIFIAKQFFIGLALGGVIGFIWITFLTIFKTKHSYLMTLALSLFVYGFVDLVGGSGALAVFVTAIMLKNSEKILEYVDIKSEHFDLFLNIKGSSFDFESVKTLHSELTFFVRTFFYVVMGIIVVFSFESFFEALIITPFLILASYLTSKAATLGSTELSKYVPFISMKFARGSTVVVLASLIFVKHINYGAQIFNISFLIIILTVIMTTILTRYTAKDIPTTL